MMAADAIGVNADGSIAIMDPSAYRRSSLSDYLAGFQAQGHTIVASLAGVLRFLPGGGTPSGFVIASSLRGGAAVSWAGGTCPLLDVQDPWMSSGGIPASVGGVRFAGCDGASFPYQLDFLRQNGAVALDLGGGTSGTVAVGSGVGWQVSRVSGVLVLSPQAISVGSVVNSASLAPGISPGGIFTIFGSGLEAVAGATTVTVGGQAATILGAQPFQVNAVVPAGVTGSVGLQVTSPVGSVFKQIALSAASPGIFVTGARGGGLAQGAIVNQDGSINSQAAPAQRGQYISVYCTGLGQTFAQGGLQMASAPVTVNLNGTSLVPVFAGLAPGFVGLYQVNVLLPGGVAPGLAALSLQASGQSSNAVAVAVQ